MESSIREVLDAQSSVRNDKNFIFRPTEDECKAGIMHICYSSAQDSYTRKSSNNEVLSSWLESTFSCANLFRKREYDWHMTYVAREPGQLWGEVSWKFDVSGTAMAMSKMELKAFNKVWEDGCVLWTITTDKQKFIQSGQSLCDFLTFELYGAQTLTITAFLTGGRGDVTYQHAQLFRDDWSSTQFPFELKLLLESHASGITKSVEFRDEEKESPAEIKKGYIFRPTEEEVYEGKLILNYSTTADSYTRYNSSNEKLPGGLDHTYSSFNIFRREDTQHEDVPMVYLAKKEDSDFGKVTWKFDVSDYIDLRIYLIKMKISYKGSVIIMISTGKQCFMETGDALNEDITFVVQDATTLSITAFLKGHRGTETNLLEQTMLDRDKYIFSFSVTLYLEPGPSIRPALATTTTITEDEHEKSMETKPGFTFKPTEEECERGMMHICYSSANDAYIRKSSKDEVMNSWPVCTDSYLNIFHKEEGYKWLAYLARPDGNVKGKIKWTFDLTDTDLKMSKIELKAATAVIDNGSISWDICGGDQCFTPTSASLQNSKTFILHGTSTLSIVALLKGEGGKNAWKRSQLFPQSLDDKENNFPFEMKLFFSSSADNTLQSTCEGVDPADWRGIQRGLFALPAQTVTDVAKSFVFKPTKEECQKEIMHIGYHCSKDCYIRKSSNNEELPNWLDCTYSSTNVSREEERDNDNAVVTYLGRIDGTQFAEVTWKFDLTGTDSKMKRMELKACTQSEEDACIMWGIYAGEHTRIETGASLQGLKTFNMNNVTSVSITAFLFGGRGVTAWKQAQLFQQGLHKNDEPCPFDVKLYLQHSLSCKLPPSVEPRSDDQKISATTESPLVAATPRDVKIRRQMFLYSEMNKMNGKAGLGIPATTCTKIDKEFVFKPTPKECEAEMMHICYSSAADEFIRKSSDDEVSHGWLEHTYSSTNVFRKVEYDHKMTYLSREEGAQFGEVTWRFDVSEHDHKMTCLSRVEGAQFGEVTWRFDVSDNDLFMGMMKLKAPTKLYEDGCVIWTIEAGEKKYIQTGPSLEDIMVFDLGGASTLSIKAYMTGGIGLVAWQHAQLFRQPLNGTTYPFEMKLYLESQTGPNIESVPSLSKCSSSYTFMPTSYEEKEKKMCLNYSSFKDCYMRESANGETEELPYLNRFAYSCINIIRKKDDGVVFLTRKDNSSFGEVSWRFDLHGTNLRMKSLRVRAASGSHQSISWSIFADTDKQCFCETGDPLDRMMTFELQGSKTLSITAFIKEGADWSDACLFRQGDTSIYDRSPFQVLLDLE